MSVRRKYIRGMVDRLLDDYPDMQPPINVRGLAQELGAHLYENEASDDLSGFLYRSNEANIPILGVNSTHHENRRRFTIAHEIGHLLLHEGDKLRMDRRVQGISIDEPQSNMQIDEEEVEANYFAAELLMPKRFIDEDIAHYQQTDIFDDANVEAMLKHMAERYEVSKHAMTIRLTNLGYIRLV